MFSRLSFHPNFLIRNHIPLSFLLRSTSFRKSATIWRKLLSSQTQIAPKALRDVLGVSENQFRIRGKVKISGVILCIGQAMIIVKTCFSEYGTTRNTRVVSKYGALSRQVRMIKHWLQLIWYNVPFSGHSKYGAL